MSASLISGLPLDLPLGSHTCCAQEAVAAPAAGFRVSTDVFFGTQKEPAQQTLTLFMSGVAYDISFNDPNSITMVDPQRERIVLLNRGLKTQAVIDLNELQQFIESARRQAETTPELAVFLKGADRIAVEASGVSVGDSALQYQATLQKPREASMAQQYATYADALALLNGWQQAMPPFARISLNRVVAEQQALPEEITRTTSSGKQTDVVRCRLHINGRLSKDDERQIAEIGRMLVNFETVSVPQFFQAFNQAAPAAQVAGQGPAPK